MKHPKLNDLTMDAMAELLNMGMGKAASELSGMVDAQEVEITVPNVRVITRDEAEHHLLKDIGERCQGYCQRFIGDFEGNYLIAFNDDSVASLKSAMAGSKVMEDQSDDSEAALVSRVGYIMTSTTFGAVSALLSSAVLSDRLEGEYIKGSADELVARAVRDCDSEAVIACEIEFSLTEFPVFGQLLMVLTQPERFVDLVASYVENI